MEIRLLYNAINIEITYDDDGYLEHVKNLHTGKHMMIESKIEGSGYEIKRDNFLIENTDVCDARYVRIMEFDIFIPRLIFIVNKK